MSRGRLSETYEAAYAELLARVAEAPRIRPRELALFWPKVGASYDGDLLVIGRAVNGWIDRWDLEAPSDPPALAATARATAEGTVDGDQLGWIIDRWKRRDGGYDTSTSQYWQTVREVTLDGHPERETNWPAYIAWTNLGKLAPWTGGNPGSRLLAIQRELCPALLEREIDELSPRLVVALTGRWWFEPFADALGLGVAWRDGLVEGVAQEAGRRWVIAVHPMTRSPHAVARAVLDAAQSTNAR